MKREQTDLIGAMRLGDAANALVLVNTAAFLGAVVLHAFGRLHFFSASFLSEGFCVSFKDAPLLQSHILCFYVDTISALILWRLARRSHAAKGSAPLASAAMGVFGHGLAHLGLWAGYMRGGGSVDQRPGLLRDDLPLQHHALAIAGLWAFFAALLRSAPNVPSSHAALHAAIYAPILALMVPPRFGFTFVQTVLLLVACAYDMLQPAKDRHYDLAALMINLPIGLVAWVEASGCDAFLRSLGGHVWYDATIPLSMFAYYAVALGSSTQPVKPGTKLPGKGE